MRFNMKYKLGLAISTTFFIIPYILDSKIHLELDIEQTNYKKTSISKKNSKGTAVNLFDEIKRPFIIIRRQTVTIYKLV